MPKHVFVIVSGLALLLIMYCILSLAWCCMKPTVHTAEEFNELEEEKFPDEQAGQSDSDDAKHTPPAFPIVPGSVPGKDGKEPWV